MQQEIRLLIDDIDGTSADVTRQFVIDGKAYEIDLSEAHSATLDKIFAPFIAHARRGGRTRTHAPASVQRARSETAWRNKNAAIRAWAAKRGIHMGTKGRIPERIREAYEADMARQGLGRPEAVRESAHQVLETSPSPARRALAEKALAKTRSQAERKDAK